MGTASKLRLSFFKHDRNYTHFTNNTLLLKQSHRNGHRFLRSDGISREAQIFMILISDKEFDRSEKPQTSHYQMALFARIWSERKGLSGGNLYSSLLWRDAGLCAAAFLSQWLRLQKCISETVLGIARVGSTETFDLFLSFLVLLLC